MTNLRKKCVGAHSCIITWIKRQKWNDCNKSFSKTVHLAFLLRGCVKTNQWFAVFAAGLVARGSVNCFIWVRFRGRKKKWCLRHQGVDESLILSICCSLSPFNPGDSFGGLKVKHSSYFSFLCCVHFKIYIWLSKHPRLSPSLLQIQEKLYPLDQTWKVKSQ